MSRARHLARKRAVQALYMWGMTGDDVSDIEAQFMLEQDMKNTDIKYFKELLHQVPAHVQELDDHITPLLDRPFSELDPVECAIMRLGIYELQHRIDIPYKVVINEAVELTKIFGAEEGHKYVNSILDKAAKKLRSIEVSAKKSSSNR
ncbi:transcription antitermination factor NusB [Kaarinaea lacus]